MGVVQKRLLDMSSISNGQLHIGLRDFKDDISTILQARRFNRRDSPFRMSYRLELHVNFKYGQSRLIKVRRNPVKASISGDGWPFVLKTLSRSARVMPGLIESTRCRMPANQASWLCAFMSTAADCAGRNPPTAMTESSENTRSRRVILFLLIIAASVSAVASMQSISPNPRRSAW